jgi:hypothetical protein
MATKLFLEKMRASTSFLKVIFSFCDQKHLLRHIKLAFRAWIRKL